MDQQLGSVLVDSQIRELIENNKLIIDNIEQKNGAIQPCSLDLRIGKRGWNVNGMPNIEGGFNSDAFIKNFSFHEFKEEELLEGIRLQRNNIYIFELDTKTSFDKEWALINPKSSAGRIDLQCIVLADGSTEFNLIPKGHRGKLWIIIVPQSFSVELKTNIALVQMRIYKGDRKILSDTQLRLLHAEHKIITNDDITPLIKDDKLILRLSLKSAPSNLTAINRGEPIDISKKKHTNPRKYFFEKHLDDWGGLWLEPGDFVLLHTMENLNIAKYTCAEMIPFSEQHGEFRSHYAGFFDRGFAGAAVCEVRNISSAPIRLVHGQPMAQLRFEYLQKEPAKSYAQIETHYYMQPNIRLAKFFEPWDSEEQQTGLCFDSAKKSSANEASEPINAQPPFSNHLQ